VTAELSVTFCYLVVNRISYCRAPLGRYFSVEQAGRIDALLRRAKRYDFADCYYDFCETLELADVKIFKNILMEHRCLHHTLPPLKPGGSYLRMRGHNFNLSRCRYELYHKSFVPRCLYKFVQWS
jgi:hypothetical protein